MAKLKNLYGGPRGRIALPEGETAETLAAKGVLTSEGVDRHRHRGAWSIKVVEYGAEFEGFGETPEEARENLLGVIRSHVEWSGFSDGETECT